MTDLMEMHRFDSLDALRRSKVLSSAKGPVAAVLAEDDVEIASTLNHLFAHGFRLCVLFAPGELSIKPDPRVIRVDFATLQPNAIVDPVNTVVQALPENTWLYYGYNAEYLFYPFQEHRTVGEMLAFHAEERRSAMLTYVVDLYAGDLSEAPNAVSLSDAHLDRSGYYALSRQDDTGPKERQLDFFGGLRWRFEEHVDDDRRRIDRIAIVRTRKDIALRHDHTWTDEELNTFACPWHHNITAAVASFRTAKALRANPSSRYEIDTFRWYNSISFEWKSQQLLDLGLMEPGQWF